MNVLEKINEKRKMAAWHIIMLKATYINEQGDIITSQRLIKELNLPVKDYQKLMRLAELTVLNVRRNFELPVKQK